jgi:putative hydrolase of the HAD superfamily
VPPPLTWSHEVAASPVDHPRFAELATISELPAWLARCEASLPAR